MQKVINYLKYLFLISLLSSLSCLKNNTTNENIKNDLFDSYNTIVIKIPDFLTNSEIDLENLVSSVNFVSLETNPNCHIGQINEVLSDTGYFFIHDKENNLILRFSSEGKFLNRIGAIGDGPGEFKEAYDVSLNKAKKELSVLDLKGRKIINYNYSGTHLNTSAMKFLFTQFEYSNDTMVCNIYKSFNVAIPSIYGYKVIKTDQNFNVLFKALPYNINSSNSFTTEKPLRKFGDSIYYNDPYKNKIYKINSNNICEKFKIDFNENGWNENINFEELNDSEIKDLFEHYSYFNGNFVASSNYLVLNVNKKNKSSTVYYSIKTGEMKFGNSYRNPKNRFQLIWFKKPQWINYDDKFITSIEPFYLMHHMEYIKNDSSLILTKNEQEILNDLKEEDNPILAIYELNNF